VKKYRINDPKEKDHLRHSDMAGISEVCIAYFSEEDAYQKEDCLPYMGSVELVSQGVVVSVAAESGSGVKAVCSAVPYLFLSGSPGSSEHFPPASFQIQNIDTYQPKEQKFSICINKLETSFQVPLNKYP